MARSQLDAQNSSEFEESLARNQAESFDESQLAQEQAYYQQLAEEDNRSRRAAQLRQEITRQLGKRVVKKAIGTGARAGAVATAEAGGAAVAAVGGTTAGPVILVVVGVLIAIFLFFVVLFGSLYYVCTDTGWTGFIARIGSKVANWTGAVNGDICVIFPERSGETAGVSSAVQPPTQDAPPAGQDLVAITGIPVEGASDPRLRPCMLAHMQLIYSEAQKVGINFVITSAYRNSVVADSGSLSAHTRGEAVDIALRPRGDISNREFNKKVRTLVGIAEVAGFKPPQGDTLDEYNFPTSGATAPHIHIEYNTPPNGKSYCTNPTNYDEYTP